MTSYEQIKQKIISTLMGRPTGTEILPENEQDYALSMLDYTRSLELIASSTLMGVAEATTSPVQPDSSRVCYIAGIGQNRTVTFQNFHNESGTSISITTSDMQGVFVILMWNGEFWSYQSFDTNIISQADQADFYYSYNIKKTYDSVSLMNADKNNPIGTDGKYIKIGDIVTVVNTTTPAENGIYSYQGLTSDFKFQSSFNFQISQTPGSDQNVTMSQKAITEYTGNLCNDVYKKSNPNDDEGNVVDTNKLLGVKGNAHFFAIITDLVGKVLEIINLQGVHKFFAGIDIQGSLHFVTTNPKFIWMLVDSENRFIIGIDKETGSPRYGVGVPIQIKEYIDNAISNVSADVLKQVNEVIARLSDRIMITDGVGGILFTDSEGKVLFTLGLNGENKSFLPLNVQGSSFKVMTNDHFFLILLDKDDKAVFYIDREGNVNWQKGVPKVVQDWVVNYTTQKISDVNSYNPNDVYERNKGRVAALQNACQKLYQGSNKDFQLEIVTDSHADTKSVEDAISFCNNFKTIDAIIHCGDIVGRNGWSEQSYITDTFIPLMKTCKKPWFICIGNHDVGNTSFVPWGVNHDDAYTMYIKPMIDNGILKEGEYQEGKCYYYHDITGYNQNIRLIVLYEYDQPLDVADTEYWKVIDYESSYPQLKGGQYTYDANNPIRVNCGDYKEHSFELLQSVNVTYAQYASDKTQPYFRIYRGAELIRQEQAEWFRDTLLNTPEDYGIIIATHNPFSRNAHNQVNYNFADNIDLYGRTEGQYGMTTDLIGDVANAYNKKSILEEKVIIGSYSFHDGTYLNTTDEGDGTKYYYKLVCDFTKVRAKILGFVGGHAHKDLVFKHEDYNLWGINPICANVGGNNEGSDVAKDSTDDLAYDSITVTSWNKDRLALCRIGNLYSTGGKVRDLEIIDTNK